MLCNGNAQETSLCATWQREPLGPKGENKLRAILILKRFFSGVMAAGISNSYPDVEDMIVKRQDSHSSGIA